MRPRRASGLPSTYRVRGVPSTLDRDGTKELLEASLGIEGVAIKSIAVAASGRRSQVATISFLSTTPALLSDATQDEWIIYTSTASLVIDKHFMSFTPLYTPPEDEHKVE